MGRRVSEKGEGKERGEEEDVRESTRRAEVWRVHCGEVGRMRWW